MGWQEQKFLFKPKNAFYFTKKKTTRPVVESIGRGAPETPGGGEGGGGGLLEESHRKMSGTLVGKFESMSRGDQSGCGYSFIFNRYKISLKTKITVLTS